jgi:hypothetical protein
LKNINKVERLILKERRHAASLLSFPASPSFKVRVAIFQTYHMLNVNAGRRELARMQLPEGSGAYFL